MNTTLKVLAALTLTGSLHAASETFDFKDPKGVNNVVFKLDAPLESINGTANGVSGTITVDPEDLSTAKGKIVVDANTLTVPNAMMQEHMVGEGWLDTKKNGEISFEVKEVSEVKKEGKASTATVKGIFTLKGVSKELTAPVKVSYLPGKLADRSGGKMQGDLLVIRSNFEINRSDFGIKPGENADKVAEKIDISLSIAGAAEKK